MSLFGSIDDTPPRLGIGNLSTGEVLETSLPTQITEEISVSWFRQKVLSLSHEVLQFENTGSYGVRPLAIPFIVASRAELERLEDARRFIASLAYPEEATKAPPRFLLTWPNLFTFTAIAETVSFDHRRFNRLGSSVVMTATIGVAEIRDESISSEQIRAQGSFRGVF